MVQIGSIVKNLIPDEPFVVTKIQQMGSSRCISFTGINLKAKSTDLARLNESSPLYRAIKESASQLGLDLIEEE